jgi:hypothetical protein
MTLAALLPVSIWATGLTTPVRTAQLDKLHLVFPKIQFESIYLFNATMGGILPEK